MHANKYIPGQTFCQAPTEAVSNPSGFLEDALFDGYYKRDGNMLGTMRERSSALYSNGAGFSDIGAFNSSGAFSGGNLQYISEASFHKQLHNQGEANLMKYRACVGKIQNVLPVDFHSSLILESQLFQQKPLQQYVQSNEPLEIQSRFYPDESRNQRKPWNSSIQHCQLPSETSHGIQDVARRANSNNLLPLSVEHKILLSYVNYKSSTVPFMVHMHSKVCNGRMCYCHMYSVLISHFDNCQCWDCHICGPVRKLSAEPKNSRRRAFGDRDSSGPSSYTSDDIHPPLKHLKLDNPFWSSSTENVISPLLAPLIDRPLAPEELPHLQQWPDGCVSINDGDSSRLSSYTYDGILPPSTGNEVFAELASLLDRPPASEGLDLLQDWPEMSVSINSESIKVEWEPFRNPVEDLTSISQSGDVVMDDSHNSVRVPFLPEMPIFGHKEEMDPSSASELTNDVIFTDDSDRLNSESPTIVCEELIVNQKEEEVGVGTEFDQAKSEIKCDFIPPAHHGGLKSDSAITNNVTADSDGSNSERSPIVYEEPDHKEGERQARTKFDQVKPEMKSYFIAPSANRGEIKLEKLKTKGISLTEIFTAEQIKAHISGLRQWPGQVISEEKMGITTHTLNGVCQLCATDYLLHAPKPLYCSSCGGRIKCSVMYYSTLDDNGTRHCFCTSCYRVSRGGNITFHGFSISKAKLDKKKNDEESEESWVQCDKCEAWQHQICALFNDKRDLEGKAVYVCPKCCLKEIEIGERIPLPKSAVLGAKDLPSTKLSDHIEQRLFRRLKQEREERAKVAGKNFNEVPEAADLVVRVVSAVDKQLKVKEQFLSIFHDEYYPSEFPYRSKVILLFQKIEGVDVCLFGMYVQEFGSECSHPNQRCVYISYLDSVKYLRPETKSVTGEALRTFVYHEILIGYLDYCKKCGFATCYIWACPPLKGEDYILYCHPENQRTPKSDKLRHWYQSMLIKAVKENIVVDYNSLYDHFFVPTGESNTKVTAARLPYFDGAYWSCAAENVIRNIEQECEGEVQRKAKKLVTKRTLKFMGHTNPSADATKDILLMQKLGQTILPAKDNFIMVHLQFVCRHCHAVILSGTRWYCSQCKNFQLCGRCHDEEQILNEGHTHTCNGKEKHLLSKVQINDVPSATEDKDVILDNGVFENRHAFLSFCQDKHHQFDTLRRAKHASMMILHHLHNPSAHDQGSSTSDKGTEINESQARELQNVLLHACQCRASESQLCTYPNCHALKKLFRHTRNCNVRVNGGCEQCKKTWLILRRHSQGCRASECKIPRCRDLKKHAEMLALQSETRRRAAFDELVRQQAS